MDDFIKILTTSALIANLQITIKFNIPANKENMN
jgi:hypothetical protein